MESDGSSFWLKNLPQQQHGEMTVINHSTNDKCHMKFDPYSYFGGTPKKVTGTIVSNKDKVRISSIEVLKQFILSLSVTPMALLLPRWST